MSNNYLSVLRKENKRLFVFILLFLAVSLITTVSRTEVTPFYTWAMYSETTRGSDTVIIYSLEYNKGDKYNIPQIWNHHRRIMFNYSIAFYDYCLQHNHADPASVNFRKLLLKANIRDDTLLYRLYSGPAALDQYPAWLKRYISANLGMPVDGIRVYKIWTRILPGGRVGEINRTLLLTQ